MRKIWRVILVIALVLAVLGAAAAAVGYFTGASTDRMIEIVFGGERHGAPWHSPAAR